MHGLQTDPLGQGEQMRHDRSFPPFLIGFWQSDPAVCAPNMGLCLDSFGRSSAPAKNPAGYKYGLVKSPARQLKEACGWVCPWRCAALARRMSAFEDKVSLVYVGLCGISSTNRWKSVTGMALLATSLQTRARSTRRVCHGGDTAPAHGSFSRVLVEDVPDGHSQAPAGLTLHRVP